MSPSPEEKRRLVLGISGLMDMALGAALVLAAFGIIPWLADIPGWMLAILGVGFFIFGAFFAAFNLGAR
ncbi:MAG: hypothetical protein GXP40_06025 [Chloroflexi bacterium]|nr:hypothetical protein [Chloroflexota bacterium]